MSHRLPMADDVEYFETVTHQGKTIKVGETVFVSKAGRQVQVEVSSIVKKQNHYWVGYDENSGLCPWPLVKVSSNQ